MGLCFEADVNVNKVKQISSQGLGPQIARQQVSTGQSDDTDMIDLGQLFRTLWCGKWWVALWISIALGFGGYYAYALAVPKYTTTAVVTLENRQEQVVDFESVVSGLGGDQTSINTEVEILRSRELIKKLVLKLDLVSDPEFNVALLDDTGLSFSSGVGFVKTLVLGAPQVVPAPTAEKTLDTVTTAVQAAIAISNIRNTYVFNVKTTTEDPEKSKQMANTLAELYVLNQLEVKFEATQRATLWLTERVADLQTDLERAEAAVKDFNAGTELISPEALEGLNRQAKDTRERLKAATERAELLATRLLLLDEAAVKGDRAELLRLADNPALSQAKTDEFDAKFAAFMQTETLGLARMQTRKAALSQSLATTEGQIARQSKDLVTLQQLSREAEAARSIYEYFLGRLKETSVQQGIQQADSRLLSHAILPEIPSAPHKVGILALAGVLGLLVGAGGLVLKEFLSKRFRTAQHLAASTGYTVLGQIPKFPGRKRKTVIQYLKDKPASAGAEAVRNLRTSVMLSNPDRPPQVIMLTSAIPGEGKTLLSLALTQSFSGLGKKVLLIEGDMRRLIFREYFNATDQSTGLMSVLTGESPLLAAAQRAEMIGADVLLGGTTQANVADLFSSERFAALMVEARATYDIVIVDTPPVLVVPDARTIAQHVDALLFAVHWDSTDRSQVREGLHMLESINIHPSGLVLSQINIKGMKRYGYGGQYGAYSKYGQKYYTN